MTLRTIFDAYRLPPGWPRSDGFMAYAGGSAEHVWNDGEIWEAAQSAAGCVPVWEYQPGRDGTRDGAAFEAWLDQHHVPPSCVVLLAMETYVDHPYVTDFAGQLGLRYLDLYGSISTLFGNPEQDGWWPANPTGAPHLFTHPKVDGTQYAWSSRGQVPGFDVDLSMITASLHLWQPAPGPGGASQPEITTGHESLRELATRTGASPAKILRMTAQHGPAAGYPPALATYINQGIFTALLPGGITVWVPAR